MSSQVAPVTFLLKGQNSILGGPQTSSTWAISLLLVEVLWSNDFALHGDGTLTGDLKFWKVSIITKTGHFTSKNELQISINDHGPEKAFA